MMLGIFAVAVAVALVVGTVVLAVDLSSMWIPALLNRLGLADADGSAAEATVRIEAREAVLATQEAPVHQQESELADRHRSVAERERELSRSRPVPNAREEGLGTAESDWWEKQLGHPLSAAELKAQAKALGLSASGTKAQLAERIEKAQE